MKHLRPTPQPLSVVEFSRRGLFWVVEACLLRSDSDIRITRRALTYKRANKEARNLAAFLSALSVSLITDPFSEAASA